MKTAPQRNVETYDFRRPMTLAREHSRALEMAAETFARQWGTQLTSRLRVVCGVAVRGVEMISYDEYIGTLPDQTLMAVCTLDGGRSTGVLQVPLQLSLLWIDYLLAGPGLRGAVADREHTEIETTLISEVIQTSLHDLRYAFESVAPMTATLRGLQYNPQFAQLVPASEPVIVINFLIGMGEDEFPATFMLPAEPLLEALRASDVDGHGRGDESEEALEARRRMLLGMREVPVEVRVRMRPLAVNPKDILTLAVGDLVMLSHAAARPLDVVVDERIVARAVAGANGRQLACQIVEFEEN